MAIAHSWWSYPQKPTPITRDALDQLNLADFTMELKFDGWRVIIINSGTLQFMTRDKKPIRVPDPLVRLVKEMDLPLGTVLDGEIWNPFKRAEWTKIDVWDVIRDGMESLSKSPIEVRRERLRKLIPAEGDVKRIQVLNPSVESILEIQKIAWDNRSENHLESGFIHGVVLKKNRSFRYDTANRCTNHGSWMKYVFPGMKGYESKLK